MRVYIKKQGKKISFVVKKFYNYALQKNKKIKIYIDYFDYKYIHKNKSFNQVMVIFNEHNFSIHKALKITKQEKNNKVCIKICNEVVGNRLIKKIMSEKLKNIEIIIVNESNIFPIVGRNIINKDNYHNLDVFSIIHGFKEKYGCEHGSCLGNAFYIDEYGIVSFCYKNESVLGNIYDSEVQELLEESECFKELLIKSIHKRKECLDSGCKYFASCHGGCVFDNKRCYDFIEMYKVNKIKSDEILNGNFDFDEMSLSEENVIMNFISKID